MPGRATSVSCATSLERAAILCEDGPITPRHLSLHAEPMAPASGQTTDLRDAERRAIEKALRETDGNKSKTARRLGLTRTQLYVRPAVPVQRPPAGRARFPLDWTRTSPRC